ncbi:MAG: TatD family hydrolase [Candidatus Doudnabacteria bacterium]|nr:TatD family hydrolase [Candidatus Doudnabacteria bacterium]
MLFDTHTHVNFPEFDPDREQILKDAQDQGLWMTNVGCDYKSSKSAVELASKFKDGVYATVGQHPTDSKEHFDEEIYSALITDKVVAIGECGLDYYHQKEEAGINKQKAEFIKQIHFAQKLGLPLVIHCRDAYHDLIEILQAEYTGQAIIHSFTDSGDTAKKFLDLGYYIALNAILIFDKTGRLAEVAKNLPSDRILIETDAPFLSPNRGKRNEPANVKRVAERIAEIREVSLEEVSDLTFTNACRIYQLEKSPSTGLRT